MVPLLSVISRFRWSALGLRNNEIGEIVIGSECHSGRDTESADTEKRLVRKPKVLVRKERRKALAHFRNALRDLFSDAIERKLRSTYEGYRSFFRSQSARLYFLIDPRVEDFADFRVVRGRGCSR